MGPSPYTACSPATNRRGLYLGLVDATLCRCILHMLVSRPGQNPLDLLTTTILLVQCPFSGRYSYLILFGHWRLTKARLQEGDQASGFVSGGFGSTLLSTTLLGEFGPLGLSLQTNKVPVE